MTRRKKVPKEDMPVPKNGRPTNQGQKRSQEKRPERPNGSTDNQLPKSDSGDFPALEKTNGFPSSRDSSGSRGKGNKIGNGDAIVNGTGKANGATGSIKIDDERTKPSVRGNKPDAHNGVNGSRIFSASGKNKSSYASKTGGSRKSNGQGNGKPDPLFHENANVAPSKPQALDKSNQAKPSRQANDSVSNGNAILTKPNERENEDAHTKDSAVIKKYSEEPLSFFQPDLGKSTLDEPKSPSVAELCAKWPNVERKSHPEVSNDRKNIPAKMDLPVQSRKSSPVQQDSQNKPFPVPNEVPTKERYPPKKDALKKWDVPNLAPRFSRNQNNPTVAQSLVGHSDGTDHSADNSSHAEYNPTGSQPSLNFYGSSGRSRQSGDFGTNARNSGQRGSPRKSDPSAFNHHSNSNHFSTDENYDGSSGDYDGMNSRQFYSSHSRGQSGPPNYGSWGGQKRNKNGKKFNNQNGWYQGDGKKHFGRTGQGQKSPMGQHGKAGPPVGYYSNRDAYMGQNLVATLPPLMGPQPQMMNQMDGQPQMMSPVGAMQPQMVSSVGPQMLSPMQFAEDQQYTMAIFPNGYQWIDVGGLSESQQVLVQPNGEMVPLTMGSVMPYIVPYTSGLPNTGVPMLIPAVAPPMNAQTTMNGQVISSNSPHPDPNTTNNTQLCNQNFNEYGANVTYPMPAQTAAQTISHSVSSHVGPIPACTESQHHVAQSQLEKTWESGTPTRAPTGYPDATNCAQSDALFHRSDTPESTIRQNQVPSPVADRLIHAQTPGTPMYGSPTILILDTPSTNGTPSDWNGTPGAWNVTPSTSTGTPVYTNGTPGPLGATPCTPQNEDNMNAKGQPNKIKMMSLAQVERMQKMSSANGKRVPMNARNKDSPNHMPTAPQEVPEELVKFICDSWNKVHQEYQKGSTAVAYYDDPCQIEGFVPFDLEAYWGKRLVQNMTNQNIPAQNM